jgi:hypothetical protein
LGRWIFGKGKTMIFRISIHSVGDGDVVECATYSPDFALDFLNRHDHEGSTMSMIVTMAHEEVYEFLKSRIKE